jgi:hypothetical protein
VSYSSEDNAIKDYIEEVDSSVEVFYERPLVIPQLPSVATQFFHPSFERKHISVQTQVCIED